MVPFIRCQHWSKLPLAFIPVLLIAIMVLTSCSPAPVPPASPFITANTPTGPSAGEVNQPLTFSTNASSNIAGSLEYRFDWGDGSYSGWSPSPSASHSWSNHGTYTVRAQARHPGVVSDWSGTRSVTVTLPSPPPTSDASASLPTSADVNLSTYSDITKFDISGYSSITKSCVHAGSAVSLAEGQTITLMLESDCVINWYNPNSQNSKPEISVIFGQAWSDGTISTGAKKVKQVSFFNEGKAAQIVLSPSPISTKSSPLYRLIAWNHDPHDSHYLKYSIRNGVASPPVTWTPSGPSLITLPRSPWNPEIMRFYITPDDSEVKAAVKDILGQQLRVFTDFETLRDWVSWHISYQFDQDVHSVRDYWQLPIETLELGTGDCEDFAILLCSLLRAYGVPADQVYVAVGVNEDKTCAHAYLVEKWYQGIWRVTEPQAGAWAGVFLGDWATSVTYKELYCFNDQDYFEGPSTLPLGVYEFQLSFSGGTSATFERYMSSGQMITASVEWLGKCGDKPEPFTIFGWGLRIYDPNGRTVLSWFGGDLFRSFSFAVPTSGKYKVQVYIGGVLPASARLTIDPPDWSGQ